MSKLTVGSLFAGIGGFDLGLERAGMEIKWQVEIDPFCRKVLEKHWPQVRRYEDVRTVGKELGHVDVICGGFPCQPVSSSGKRRAQADERWLWPHFARLIRDLLPRFVIVENVAGLRARGMSDVLGDLAASGFDAEWESLPAASVGAWHLRDRVWIVAYPRSEQWRLQPLGVFGRVDTLWPQKPRAEGHSSDAHCGRLAQGAQLYGEAQQAAAEWHSHRRHLDGCRCAGWFITEPGMGRVVYGIPTAVDRLKGLGNAIVPQIAEWIGRRIIEAEAESLA